MRPTVCFMIIPLRVAHVLLVVAATMFAMALAAETLITESVVALVLAGQLVGGASKR